MSQAVDVLGHGDRGGAGIGEGARIECQAHTAAGLEVLAQAVEVRWRIESREVDKQCARRGQRPEIPGAQVIRAELLQPRDRDLLRYCPDWVEVGGAWDAACEGIGKLRLIELEGNLSVEAAGYLRGVSLDAFEERSMQVFAGAAVGNHAVTVRQLNSGGECPRTHGLDLHAWNMLAPDLHDGVEVTFHAVPHAAGLALWARGHLPRARATVDGERLEQAGGAADSIRTQASVRQLRQMRKGAGLPHHDIGGLRHGSARHGA